MSSWSWLSRAVKIVLAAQAAQAAHATVTGLVIDAERSEPIAGAVVELTDLARVTATDGRGRYLFRAVPAGPQHIAVRSFGFAARTLHALVPRDGRLEINVELQPDPIPIAGLEARAALPVRGLESVDSTTYPDRGVSLAAVRHHPLLAESDFLQALGGGEVVVRPESPSGIHVRGGAADHVAYVLDGIPIFSPYHAAGTFAAWNPDALSHVRLSDGASMVAYPDALSGVVAAQTRAPPSRLGAQGSLSTTQARIAVDGPLGGGGAGYLLSIRSAFPGFVFPEGEPSYVRAEIGEWLAKLEVPLLGGRLRVLAFDSENEIGAAAAPEDTAGPGGLAGEQNEFNWQSRSIGGEWRRPIGGASLHLRAWRAAGDVSALWRSDSLPEQLAAKRRDEGIVAAVEVGGEPTVTTAGLRVERIYTSYRVTQAASTEDDFSLRVRTPVIAPFVVHRRPITRRGQVELAMAAPVAEGRAYLSPRGELRWLLSSRWTLSGRFVRAHQFAQSLRNAESVVGHIFPADIYVGAGAPGLPVARSDQGIVAIEYRPFAGLRLATQVYERDLAGLALVAPVEAGPYADAGLVEGSGGARGLAIEAAASGARYGALISYGFQRVRLEYGDTAYVPEHGSEHLVAAGVIAFPTATSSIRLELSSVLGRRTTRLVSPVEWEACNVLDRGCEFAGSPDGRSEPLGASRLPAYVRVDVGVRKHWHLTLGGRDGLLGVFGTVTNVLGRKNVVAIAPDPVTGEPVEIEMRPRAPLVLGIDWRF